MVYGMSFVADLGTIAIVHEPTCHDIGSGRALGGAHRESRNRLGSSATAGTHCWPNGGFILKPVAP